MSEQAKTKEKTDTEIFFPEGKTIKICKQDFTIKPWVIKENREIIKLIVKNVSKLQGLTPKFEKASDAETLSLLADTCEQDVTRIYEITLKKEKKWIEDNVTFFDEKNIWEAIMEVNDLSFLFGKAKELIQKSKKMKQE